MFCVGFPHSGAKKIFFVAHNWITFRDFTNTTFWSFPVDHDRERKIFFQLKPNWFIHVHADCRWLRWTSAVILFILRSLNDSLWFYVKSRLDDVGSGKVLQFALFLSISGASLGWGVDLHYKQPRCTVLITIAAISRLIFNFFITDVQFIPFKEFSRYTQHFQRALLLTISLFHEWFHSWTILCNGSAMIADNRSLTVSNILWN